MSSSKITFSDSISLFFIILFISNTAAVCFDELFIRVLSVLFFIIFILKRNKFDLFFIALTIYWFLINFLFSILHGQAFPLNKVIGYFLPIFITYTCYKNVTGNFFEKFEKWIFFLSTTSLIFFAIQLVTGNLFHSLTPYLGHFMADFYREARPSSWYIYIFTYCHYSDLIIRNSGFMWEPGAYAMICCFGLIYQRLANGSKITYKSIIYILAIITTMSTAGYIALLLYFIIYLKDEKNIFKWFMVLILFAAIIPFVYGLEFMAEKIDSYISNQNEASYSERYDAFEYNRFTVFQINFERLFEYPIGYGVFNIKDHTGSNFIGVNGIATFARMWGFIGLIVACTSIFKSLRLFNKYQSKTVCTIALIMLFVLFFSNPIERNPLFYFLIIHPHLFNKKWSQKNYPGYL